MKLNILVHKANINLLKNETINKFTKLLRSAGEDYVRTKQGLDKKKSYVWMYEATSEKAIFNVEKNGEYPGKYYSVDYTRDKNGNFAFGTVIEVERVTSFEPKKPTIVMKSVSGGWIKKEPWNGLI